MSAEHAAFSFHRVWAPRNVGVLSVSVSDCAEVTTTTSGYELSLVRVFFDTNFPNPGMDLSQPPFGHTPTVPFRTLTNGSSGWDPLKHSMCEQAISLLFSILSLGTRKLKYHWMRRHELDRAVREMSPFSTGLGGRLFDGEDMINTATCRGYPAKRALSAMRKHRG